MRERSLPSVFVPLVCCVLGLGACKQPPKHADGPRKVTGEKELAQPEAKSEQPGEAKADKPAKPVPKGVYTEIGKTRGGCQRSLCIGGPAELWAHPHFDLNEVCRRTRGSVQRCEQGLCTSVWPEQEWRDGLDALVASLDTDGDGKLNKAEADCQVSFGGWSFGASIAAGELAAAYLERAPEGGLDNLLLVAPELHEAAPKLTIDPHFARAFTYRSTRASKGECVDAEGKARKSPAPSCSAETTCLDYDYAALGEVLAYIGRRGNRVGNEIDPCNMPSFLTKAGRSNLDRGLEGYTNAIPPYAGGTVRGGRDPHARPEDPPPSQ